MLHFGFISSFITLENSQVIILYGCLIRAICDVTFSSEHFVMAGILPVGGRSGKAERIIMKLKPPIHGDRLKSKICPYGPREKEKEHKSLQVLDEAWCNAQYATRINRRSACQGEVGH